MRWERLFAELEGQVADEELLERDVLVEELTDGEWSQTPWSSRLAGSIELEAVGCGVIRGTVASASDSVVHLDCGAFDMVVARASVLGFRAASAEPAVVRKEASDVVARRLGWGHVFRALRDEGALITAHRIDGSIRDGRVSVVAADAALLSSDHESAERRQVGWWLPFAAVAAIRSRESP